VTSTAARAHLESLAGPEKGQTLRVAPHMTVIGRDATCDLPLAETTISRQHARIEHRGEQWVLKNLSANGTLVNKKLVDEVVLADRDEIRLGAKTRLRFVIETVAVAPGGRPQFRRRVTAAQEEAAKADADKAEGEEEVEAAPSIFKRGRKKLALVILLALPSLLFLGLIVYKSVAPGGQQRHSEVEVMNVEDLVLLRNREEPLLVERTTPDGTYCKDSVGNSILVPPEDFASQKATRIPGFRSALDVKFKNDPDPAQAESFVKRALEQYSVRAMPGKDEALFWAVRYFQQALSYTPGRLRLPDNAAEGKYEEALKELIKTVDSDYRKAIQLDKADDYKKAKAMYDHLLRVAPDRTNPIYQNVARRMTELKGRHPDLL
jgi:tetratricopeptide (TPR) repeat protein